MKKSKKFVLAGFALLAITGLLALAGCKNDSVPEPTRYTVKFETDHGTDPDDITVVSGTKLTDKDLAIEPEVGDNIFEYWYDKDDDTQKPVEEGYTVTKDVTLVAKWRDRGTVASVAFTPDGGALYYGNTVTLSSQEGATIHYTVNGGEEKNGASPVTVSVTGDTTITARATKDELKPSDATTATYTVRQLEGITVTPPTRTVYSVGEKVASEIEVTATYDDGEERTVTGTITTDTSTLTESAGIGKPVTVSYMEGGISKTTTFTVTVFPAEVKVLTELEYTNPNYTGSGGTYVAFGEWPQTIKADNVTVDDSEGKGKEMGMFTCYLGSDDNYYVKAEENAYEAGYKYSDASEVKQKDEGSSPSTQWFKVEPIVWRVLTTNYEVPEGGTGGEVLLLAEKILTGGIEWDYSNNDYMHSYIRQWLNGNSWTGGETSDYNGDAGFLQTAFTQSALGKIAPTTVDNSADSTTDKIFLLSQQEATNREYGFAASSNGDSTRIRVTTDYAKATGAYQGDSTEGYGGRWWLRSPGFNGVGDARCVSSDGDADDFNGVIYTYGGVVPALSISLQ